MAPELEPTRAGPGAGDLLAALAAGFAVPPVLALLQTSLVGWHGEALLEFALLSTLLVVTPALPDALRRLVAVLWPPAAAILVGTVLHRAVLPPAGLKLLLAVATLLLALPWGLRLGECLRRGVPPSLAGALFLGGGAVGLCLSILALPLASPPLLLVVAVALFPLGSGGRRAELTSRAVAGLLLLLAASGSHFPAGARFFPPAEGTGARAVWHEDGPATVVRSAKGAVQTSLAGGRFRWSALRRGTRRSDRDLLPLAVAAAVSFPRKGSTLLLGPGASGYWTWFPPRPGGSTLVLAGTGRLGQWARRSMVRGGKKSPAPLVAEQPARRFLANRVGEFSLIVMVDARGDGQLTTGEGGRQPAYHLTVEGMRPVMASLRREGILVADLPYGLKGVVLLKELAGPHGRFSRKVAVYADRQRQRNVLVYSHHDLDRPLLDRLRTMALRRGDRVEYEPGAKRPVNAYRRLITSDYPMSFYASSSDEISPPRDDRPFYYQAHKLIPRTRGILAGLPVGERGRLLGIVPHSDLPWIAMLLMAAAAFAVLAGLGRPAGWSGRPQALVAPGVLATAGLAGGLLARGGVYVFWPRDEASGSFLVAALVLGGFLGAAGLLAGGAALARRMPSVAAALLLLPAVLLPQTAAFWPATHQDGTFRWMLAVVACLPAGLIVGVLHGRAEFLGRTEGGRPDLLLAAVGLGFLLGLELAIPLAQMFGLRFTLVLVWVLFLLASRLIRSTGGAAG